LTLYQLLLNFLFRQNELCDETLMTRGRKAASLLVIAVAFLAISTSPRAQEKPGERFTVSLPTFTLGNQGSVFGFICTVAGGGIVSLNTPYLWIVKVDNGSSPRARVDAHIIDGVARFYSASQLNYFRDFITVEKRQYHGRPRFDVTVKVIVATDRDLETHRFIKFSLKQLLLTPRR